MILPIFDGKTQIGKATVEQEGMYAVIRCVCMPVHNEPSRLYLQNNNETIPLGLCVPDGKSMSLLKRLPIGHLQDKLSVHVEEDLKTYPYIPGTPFEMLERLIDARLRIRNGKYYILMSPSSKTSSTGQ